jgi:protein-S-isoprenylcysteine O-methyltransferase Ste14
MRRMEPVLAPGTLVDGYALGEVLGQGGFGVVYRARGPAGGEVAIKVARRAYATVPIEHLVQQQNEVEALVRLRHPSLVDVQSYGHREDGTPATASRDIMKLEGAMREFLLKRGFILPVMVTGVIPIAFIAVTRAWQRADVVSIAAGAVIYALGLSMLIFTTRLFARHDGSLAPWNPPRTMVTVGPYRHCRNPMITSIFTMLLGEAVALRSPWIGGWLLFFVAGQFVYILIDEEPLLRKRFGEEYLDYCQHVPRWIPRLTPYTPPASQ